MLSPGAMLNNRYRLDERIAGGGMGDVWRGTDEVLGRTVAIKVLLPALLEEPGFAERFRGEARTMANLNHPGVVDVYDYGNEGGTAFLIMEYIEGDALSRTLARVNRLTPARTMALIAQAADALHAAHIKGIVHRDVKPGNLLVRPNGTLVLTDFGIARSAQAAQLTQAGSVLGTASYISPEQASGQGATPLSDVYALGVVAYQCLAGRRPFEGDNPFEIAMRHVRENPPPLPPDIPPAVVQIVERAMAKDPASRYPTAEAFGVIARRAAQQLAATGAVPGSPVVARETTGRTPSHGPVSGATGPVSGAPDSAYPAPVMPVSGVPGSEPGPANPVSGAPNPVSGPSGTMMMSSPPGGPGVPGDGPVAAGEPPKPGQFARGSAGVPPAPEPASDTGYTYVGTGPLQPVAPGATPGQPVRDTKRTALIVLAAALGALLLLGCVGGGFLLLNGAGDKNKNGGGSGSTPTPSAQPAAQQTTIDCKDMRGEPIAKVKKHLEEKDGFKVNVVEVDDPAKAGTVLEVPCSAEPGSQIDVKVSNGRGTPTNRSGQSTDQCSPGLFGGIASSRNCPTTPAR